MHELLKDSHAAQMYLQTFLDRSPAEFHSDQDNGLNYAKQRTLAVRRESAAVRRESVAYKNITAQKKVSNRLPKAMANPNKSAF